MSACTIAIRGSKLRGAWAEDAVGMWLAVRIFGALKQSRTCNNLLFKSTSAREMQPFNPD